jgi:hypothetical protein
VTLVRDADGLTDWSERRRSVDDALHKAAATVGPSAPAEYPDEETWGLLPEHVAAEAPLLKGAEGVG